jgi:chromosomal replication initiation ATPase DnaA
VNPWEQILLRLREAIDEESYRRWFSSTSYASDSGDQITVWVLSEPARRHILVHYQDLIDDILTTIDRADTHVRLIVSGLDEDEDGSPDA